MEANTPSDWDESQSAAIRAQLARILASNPFAKAGRRSKFLEYIVNETLAGRGAAIKGYLIGIEVFSKPPDFDPATDPIVRVEAGRLRDRLQEYYRTVGLSDPILIALPKGAYAPQFEFRELAARDTGPDGLAIADQAAADTPAEAGSKTLAVLPFANLSNDVEQQYFADGLTDNLITDLSKLSSLTVISRHSSFVYRNTQKSAAEIADDLGVRYVVEGSVIRSLDRVRISTSLVDTVSDRCLWAERYDRELTDVFAVQDDVSRCIVGNLELKLTPLESDRLGHEGTTNLAAHDMLMRGLAVYWHYTRETCAEAVGDFAQAVAIDPYYAVAHAWLARAYVYQYTMTWIPEFEKSLGPALTHARRAVELDDLLPLAHSVLGWASFWHRDFQTAVRAGRRACTLDPNDADAHLLLSHTLSHIGQAGEGMRYIDKGMRLNPRPSAFYYYVLGFAQLALKQYPAAIASLRQGIEISPTFLPNRSTLAVTYALAGDVEAGKKELAIVKEIWPNVAGKFILDAELSERYRTGRRLIGLDPT